MKKESQDMAIKWVSVALSLLMLILTASVILAGRLLGFSSLTESLLYALATIAPLAILLFLAYMKKDKQILG